MKYHIGVRVDCPFGHCQSSFITWGGFFGHLKRTHDRLLTFMH